MRAPDDTLHVQWAHLAAEAGGGYDPDQDADAGNGAARQPARRFHFLDDEALENLPPQEWLIDGVLLTQTINLVVGAPGSLKSFFALDTAAHIRLGSPWAGRATKAGSVLYVLAEGVKSFGLRLRAWKAHHGHVGPLGIQFLTSAVQLANRAEVTHLLAAIKQHGDPPSVIYIDTQSRCTIGQEENSSTDMGLVIDGVERIQRITGATIVLLHHTPRDADRERGSTALRAGVDGILVLVADGDHLTVKVDRQKDGDTDAVFKFRKRIIALDDSDRSSCVLVPVADAELRRAPKGLMELPRSERQLIEAIARGAVTSNKQLMKVSEVAARSFWRGLKGLRGRGLVAAKGLRLTPGGWALVNGHVPDDGDGGDDCHWQ